MIYKLIVNWSDDEGDQEIALGGPGDETSVITGTAFWIDTLDDNSKVKAKGTLARLNIKGKIDAAAENKKQVNGKLTKIFHWATDFKNDTTYRKVTVEIYADGAKLYRKYEIDRVFVRDYKETFQTVKGEDGKDVEEAFFEIDLTQQENQWDKVFAIDV